MNNILKRDAVEAWRGPSDEGVGNGGWGRRACLHAVRGDSGLQDTGRVMGELSPGPGAELLY